jgi:hypothetical protein
MALHTIRRGAIAAEIALVAGKILNDTTILGVTGTFDLDALMVNAGFAAGKVSMTISSTTSVDPAFTAAGLVDANFLWVAPNGTSFTGKAPAEASFVTGGVGTYRVYCTNWAAVTVLDCNTDNVTALDVAVATALTYLYCYSNALTALDVATNTLLIGLDCASNALTALDVATNTLLISIDCGSNALTALDVATNTPLTYLYCYSNALTALDVSANTLLTALDCQDNALTSTVVNAILAALVAAAVNTGTASLEDQTYSAQPTGQGITDLATLTAVAPGRAWTITTD